MRLLRRCLELSRRERRLFCQAALAVFAVRVALWTIPFRLTRRWVDRMQRTGDRHHEVDPKLIREVAWAVASAGRRVPCATCLTQGLATQILLGRLGQNSELCLGVARGASGRLEAHAWVEARGCIVIGGAVPGFDRFARLENSLS